MIQHSEKTAKDFLAEIRKTKEQDGKPGKNRSCVISTSDKKAPLVLISNKPPSAAAGLAKTTTPKAAQNLLVGQIFLQENEIRIKVAKGGDAKGKAAFKDYFATYKVSLPTKNVVFVEYADGESMDFVEDAEDRAGDVSRENGEDDGSGNTSGEDKGKGKLQALFAGIGAKIDALATDGARSDTVAKAVPVLRKLLADAEKAGDAAKASQVHTQAASLHALLHAEQAFGAQASHAAPAIRQAGLVITARTGAADPAVQQHKASFEDARGAMQAAAAKRDYRAATAALRSCETAAAQLLTRVDVLDAPKRAAKRQGDLHAELAPVLDLVANSYFTPDGAMSSKRLGKEDLNAGKTFKAVLKAVEVLEAAKGKSPAVPANLLNAAADQVGKAAQAFLDHVEKDYSSREKASREGQRKVQVCTELLKAARHFGMAVEFQKLPKPTEAAPWTPDQEIRAAELQARMGFERGYERASDLRATGGAGQSSTFIVRGAVTQGGYESKKNFVFKPFEGEKNTIQDKHGAGAAKEALACANGREFERQTGFSLGVPPTSVVEIGGYALPQDANGKDLPDQVGSLQQFENTDGSMKSVGFRAARKVPASECQRVAILDIISLNVDRHGGNLLVQTDADGNPTKLVPIDHGASLPRPEVFKNVAEDFGGITPFSSVPQNAMQVMPGAYEKFSPDALARLELLDPDAMKAAMVREVDALDRMHPSLGAKAKVDPNSLELSRRVMVFMKKAAPRLSPAEIQITIARNAATFADLGIDIAAAADAMIADAEPKGPAFKEFFLYDDGKREAIVKWLNANGWGGALMMADPAAALTLWKAGVPKGKNDARPAKDVADGIDADAALAAYLKRELDDIGTMLADCGRKEQPALTNGHRTLAAAAGTANLPAGALRALEAKIVVLRDDVLESALADIRAQGQALFDDNKALIEAPPNRKGFNMIWDEGIALYTGLVPHLPGAKKSLADARNKISELSA